MIRIITRIAAKSFLILAIIFFMAGWIQADELSVIKDGYNSYWSNIKDGKGSCTVTRQQFTADNPEVPQYTIKDDFEWIFTGLKIKYRWKTPLPSNNQGSSIAPGADIINEVYFDGQRVTAGSGKNFVLRKPNISDIGQTNQWDPRLIITGSARSGESWEPVPFWQAWNSKIIGKEKINGYECYVLEATIDRNGRQMVRRSWLDIERNCCLVRSEIWFYFGKDTVIPKDLEWTKDAGKYLSSRTDIELKKYGKDLWGPKKYEWINYSPNPKTKTFYISDKTTKIYDDACAYNLGLTENDLKIILPPDAKVSDASKYPADYVKPKVSIEFRITNKTPEPGFTQTNIPDSNEKVYIFDKAELTEADIKGVKVDFSTPGFPLLDILFTDEGGKKFAEVTQNHLKERMAIFVDGKLLSLPIIYQKIPGGRVQISGRLTEAEIKRIIGDEVK